MRLMNSQYMDQVREFYPNFVCNLLTGNDTAGGVVELCDLLSALYVITQYSYIMHSHSLVLLQSPAKRCE